MTTELQGMPNLNSIIERSHVRSAQYGVDPHQAGAPESTRLTNTQVRNRIQEQHEFYSLACEQLDSLYLLLKDTGFCMALADRDGYVLYVKGDSNLIERLKRRRCIPGYRWTERDMGTCAIGLVLEERMPIFLPGEKMYAVGAQRFSNAGAPVFSPNGQEVLGVISLTGYSENMHIHTLGLVRQSANIVTAQLKEADRNRELAIKNQYMIALLESGSRGLVTVDQQGCIVQTNHKARSMLQIPLGTKGKLFTDCIGHNFDIADYLKQGKGFKAREILTKKSGITHFASLDPIRINDDKLVGGLFTVFEKTEMMRIAVEMTGTHAHFTFASILGSSEKLRAALHVAHISATSTASVMLTGETGTGKELFAQAIHNESERRNGPFVAINCGAIPKELLESELFGYEEGSFTGAQKGGRPGKFELADSGTLFLDEIGDMPFDMQVKLLRVLQSGEIQRVGGIRTIPTNLRIISATNKDLKSAIYEHKFRADLFYRICTLKIIIPPLRERPEDILQLVAHFMNRHELQQNRQFSPLHPETERALLSFDWPGNIRQLESAVERAVHLSEDGVLLPEHFDIGDVPLFSSSPPVGKNRLNRTLEEIIEEVESQAIADSFASTGGNIRQAAKELGVSRPTFYRKLRKYGMINH